MTVELTSADVQRFRDLVAQRLGLRTEDSRLGQLAEVLRRRLADSSRQPEEYFASLQRPELSRDEKRALAQDLTIGETYFFRNPDQFRALAEVALPDRMQARSALRRLRILSAGCASGEEAYSLAIVVSEQADAAGWDISIRGIDLNPDSLVKAGRARYSSWALREVPSETQSRWFRTHGREFVLAEAARGFVTFEERNLAEDASGLWEPGAYDIVFCRNVLMYFTPGNAQALVKRIAASLAPAGYLFLGHAENLRGLSHDFHLRHTHGTFYYQRRERLGAAGPPDFDEPPTPPAEASSGPGPSDLAATWIDTIRSASDRIERLARTTAAEPAMTPVAARSLTIRPPWNVDLAMQLLKEERFGDALERVRSLPPEAAADPDVLLLRAALLTHNGDLAQAERACREVLGLDELNAGAHYLMALCREGSGDVGAANHHDQLAAHLDPGFAMARLHLGLLARRAGDLPRACRELAVALELLPREDSSRIILFGGGFGREALTALCRAELDACGGAP